MPSPPNDSVRQELQQLMSKIIGMVASNVTVSADDADIKTNVDALNKWQELWDSYEKSFRSVLSTLRRHARGLCKHPGAASGYNERDGAWMAKCTICGHSE